MSLRILLTVALFAAAIAPAEAAPVIGLVGSVVSAIGGLFGAGGILASGTVLGFLARGAVAFGLSYLSKALLPKPEAPKFGGFKGELQASGIVPRSFIAGRWATAGSLVYANVHGSTDKTPNHLLVQVIALSDLPVEGLVDVWVDGVKVTWDPGGGYDSFKGQSIPEFRKGGKDHLWIRFHDGNQTTADSYLTSNMPSSGSRAWTTNHRGIGVAYAIVTAKYNPKVFKAAPTFKFVLDGIPLYDVRNDTTAGGSGAERYDTPSTWSGSLQNAAAIAYNVLRGIRYGGAWFWGGQTIGAAQLPYSSWAAAANTCDDAIEISGGGTQERYIAGAEISVDEEPLAVVERLTKVMNARIAEVGGAYKIKVGGGAGTSILSFTDEGVIVSKPRQFDPIKSLTTTVTGITAEYISAGEGWVPKSAPPRYDSDAEAEVGRQAVANVTYEYARRPKQVQRLMRAARREERRERRHEHGMPPEALIVEPLDTVDWTSTRNGYSAKDFRVEWVEISGTLICRWGIVEIDPDDYDWTPDDELDDEDFPALGYDIAAQAIDGFGVTGVTVPGDGSRNRPAIRMSWSTSDPDGDPITDVSGLSYQVRRSGTVVKKGPTDPGSFDDGSWDILGLASNTDYEVRAQYIPVGDRDVDWTSWLPVATPTVKFKGTEVDDDEIDTNHIVLKAVSDIKIDEDNSNKDIQGQNINGGVSITFNNYDGVGGFQILASVIYRNIDLFQVGLLMGVTWSRNGGAETAFDEVAVSPIHQSGDSVLNTDIPMQIAMVFTPSQSGDYRFRIRLATLPASGEVRTKRRFLSVTRTKR